LGRDVWDSLGIDGGPEDHTIQQTISEVRAALVPLGIGVNFKRPLGYYLAPLPEPGRRKTPGKRGKPNK
jgi:hypothetical protein